MTEFATSQFFWGGKRDDGASTQEHVDIANKSPFAASVISDQTFAEAPEVKYCPHEVEYIWEWFIELNSTRDAGMQCSGIKHTEITAWSEGMRINITPFERRAIRAIDVAFINNQNTKSKDTK